MSNLLFMDKSNGNGVYATTITNNSLQTSCTTNAVALLTNTTTTTTIAASAAAASVATTTNTTASDNAVTVTETTTTATTNALPTSISNEDLSQSLSEYTDADESISAPTEFLAEFLSAVMLKDYKKALKYCKLILQYEPNNATAKEFYPLILDKLRGATSSDSDENYNYKTSSSPEILLDLQNLSDVGESDDIGSSDEPNAVNTDAIAVVAEYDGIEENSNSFAEPHSNNSNLSTSSCCGSAGDSLSNLVDDEDDDVDVDDDDDDDDVDIDIDDVDDDDDDIVDDNEAEDEEDEDDDDDVDEEEDVLSSSGDDLPIDEPIGIDIGACGNLFKHSNSSRNSSSGGDDVRSRSDNTTHSYSSLLLEEEEDDIVPVNLHFTKELQQQNDLDISNGNKLPSTSCSDSESPTEPLTQRLAAILRSKCGVTNN